MRAIALALVLAAPVAGHESAPGETDFAEGRRLAEEGRDARAVFQRALTALLREEAKHVSSPEFYLNVGNAAFLADDLPRAVWAFRKGLRLAPQHSRLREHLEYARAQVNLTAAAAAVPERDPWPFWLPRWSEAAWFGLFTGCHALTWMAIAWWWASGRRMTLLPAAACLAVAAVAGYAWQVGHFERRGDHHAPVVVVAKEGAALHTGNGRSYPRHPALPALQPGLEARLVAERGGWLQVRFASGTRGWLKSEDALTVKEQDREQE